MPESAKSEALSFGDALFLYLEREGMPLHIASVSVFEGAVPFSDFARFIESKLSLVPRYRQRVVMSPLNIGLPAWEYDPSFNIQNHLREVVLRRDTEREFQAAASRILSATMDRSKPLWDLTLVQGLPGGRTGLITRIHHCLADGLAGIGLMNALLDPSPAIPRFPKRRARTLPPPTPATLLDSFITGTFSAVQRVLAAHSQLLTMAQSLAAPAGSAPGKPETRSPESGNGDIPMMEQLSDLVLELATPAERLPFNVVCRGPQNFNWAEIPLADIQEIKQACEATVNDVALTAIALAVRRYAMLHGTSLKGRRLRIVVPVSVRAKNEINELGNRITFLPVSIPLDISDPRALIAAVREQMQILKTSHVAELVGLAGTLLGATPFPVQALLGPIASQLPLSICNLIFTNVRGPVMPLYLLGHRMLSCYPYVPIGGEMGINCALLTYDGTAYFGFTGDVHAAPDLARLEKFLVKSFAEMRPAAGLPPARRRPARPETKAKSATSAA